MSRSNRERKVRKSSRRHTRARCRIESLETRALLATIAVTTLDDAVDGSLRQVIDEAASGDTIDLTGLSGTITLESELTIDKSLTLLGPGQDLLSISGNHTSRVFSQTAGVVVVRDLTIRDGEGGNGFGGGWRAEGSGSLTLTRVRFTANDAGQGGAIAAIAYDDDNFTLTINQSSILGNSASSSGYAAVGAGICLYARDGTESSAPGILTFSLTDSTIASNTVTSPSLSIGGGIYARASSGLDGLGGGILSANIRNSTIADNRLTVGSGSGAITRGGGLYFESAGAESNADNDGDFTLSLTNNTIADNVAALGTGTGASADGAGAFFCTTAITANAFDITLANNLFADNRGAEDVTEQLGSEIDLVDHGHNLIESVTHMPGFVNGTNGNIIGQDAMLGTLDGHGGATLTVDLRYGSPAINAGADAYAPSTDARGIGRYSTSDIGAYEWHNTAPTWPTTTLDIARYQGVYEMTVSADDIDAGQPLAYSLAGAPAFLDVRSNENGTATLSGSPAIDDIGSHTFTIHVSDGIAGADVTVTLVVKNSLRVLNTNDSGPGSLRQAITDAGAGDAVDLTGLTGTITLESGLEITKDLAILGPGRDALTISGNHQVRLFTLGNESSGANLTIADLTLSGGEAGTGGAIYVDHASALDLSRVRITDSHATTAGGAIASGNANNSINMVDCLIDHNSAGSAGGGAMIVGDATFLRCTISQNTIDAPQQVTLESTSSEGEGAGLFLDQGTHTLTNCTIAGNSITTTESTLRIARGGGIYAQHSTLQLTGTTIALNSTDDSDHAAGLDLADGSTPTLTIQNTLIAGNTGGVDVAWDDYDIDSLVTHTLVGRMASNSLIADGALANYAGTVAQPLDAKLGTLADHGGGLPTVNILYGSPAIDAGDDDLATSSDQRDIGRFGTSDIGAYEWHNSAPVWVTNSLSNATAGHAYSRTIAASDDDAGQELTYTLVDGLTSFSLVALENGDVALAGTPRDSDVGAHSFRIRVSDGIDESFVTLGLAVVADAAPLWTTATLPGATASVPYSQLLAATDGDVGDSLSFTLVSGPAFLQVRDNANGTASLLGTPSLGDVGTFEIVLKVSDGTHDVLLARTISIVAPLATVAERTLYVNGTDGDDVITALLSDSQTIRVTRGSTTQTFALSVVSRIVMNGFGGNDSLKAQVNKLPDTILGGAGNDTIRGGGGDDQLAGDDGSDYVDAGAGRNTVNGGSGNDTLTGGNSADRLSGDDGNDVISGRGGPDILSGGADDDYIDTGSDRNRANGGAGDDTLVGGNSADRLAGDPGNDLLIGNRGKDNLNGGDGTDTARIDGTDILVSIEVTA